MAQRCRERKELFYIPKFVHGPFSLLIYVQLIDRGISLSLPPSSRCNGPYFLPRCAEVLISINQSSTKYQVLGKYTR